jgi:hypothetical protein
MKRAWVLGKKENKEKKMTKEVVKKENTEVAVPDALRAAFKPSDNPGISHRDIVISKILLMQHMSEKVVDRKEPHKYGEARDSVTDEVLAEIDEKNWEFIPFHVTMTFIEFNYPQGKKTFHRVVPIVTDPLAKGYNDELPYEDEVGGEKISRDRCINVYTLDPSNPALAPRIITFRRSNYQSGKKLLTQMYVTNAGMELPPYAYIFKMVVKEMKNDDGTWCVFDVSSTGKFVTSETVQLVESWKKRIGQVKEDQSDIDQEFKQASKEDADGTTF